MSSNKKRDYYDVLSIGRNATAEEIKKAYRAVAKKYHPDLYKGSDAEERMKEINEANEVLSDPNKRAAYDKYGHDGASQFHSQGFSQGGFANFGDIFGNIFDDIGSVFDMFGGGSKRKRQSEQKYQGADIFQKVYLSFRDAVLGKTIKLDLNLEVACDQCNETGAASKDDIQNCTYCNGMGYETIQQRTPLGIFESQNVCSKCRGEGKIIKNKCRKCHGKKLYLDKRELKFDLPKGIRTGQQIRLRNEGHYGLNGASRGDAYIEVIVAEDKYFNYLDGLHLSLTLPVSYLDALLGKEVMVPTLEKKQKIKLKPGTKSGDTITIPNAGNFNPNNDKKRGDLYIIVDVILPKKLSKEEKELLNKLDVKNEFHPNEDFNKEFK